MTALPTSYPNLANVAVLVPTCDMAQSLQAALQPSDALSALLAACHSWIFIDDGSQDDTPSVLAAFVAALPAPLADKVQILRLPHNIGRFAARAAGATHAQAENLLFLDTRIRFDNAFVAALDELPPAAAAMGVVRINEGRSRYARYWARSHAWLFAHGKRPASLFWLTAENFHTYEKGMGIFYVQRALFLRTCAQFDSSLPLSDDNALLAKMVESTPILVAPQLAVEWWPREDLAPFLQRLWSRGPSFVEFHLGAQPTWLGRWAQRGAWALSVAAALLLLRPDLSLPLLGIAGLLLALSARLLCTSWREWRGLWALHCCVVLTFGGGVLWAWLRRTAQAATGSWAPKS